MKNSKLLFRISLIFIILFTLITTMLVVSTKKINESLERVTKTSLIEDTSMPTSIYENSTSICVVGKNKQIIRKSSGEILMTKPVVIKEEFREFTFSLIEKSIELNYTNSNEKYEAKIYPCQLLQMYVLWKENTGRLTSDKLIVEFVYEALSKIGLASVNINGKGDTSFAASSAGADILNRGSILFGEYTTEDIKTIAVNLLGSYKDKYERNSMSFKNKDLITKYTLLKYLRYSRTLASVTLNYFPIFTIFNSLMSNQFYQEIFRASSNASKPITLTYHYTRSNPTGGYFYAT